MNGIPQSAVIFGAFVLMFLAFITAKGELPLYMGFLFGGSSGGSGNSGVSANSAAVSGGPPGSIYLPINPSGVLGNFFSWFGAKPA